MKRICWCKKQAKGIKLTEPSNNISKEYYQSAEESLRVLKKIHDSESNMWLATTKYYIEYFAVYSILAKIGIKCEIHDCTIALVKFLEKEDVIKKGTAKALEKDKKLRIDNQYYLKNKQVNIKIKELSDFIITIREAIDNLDEEKIKEIREEIRAIGTKETKTSSQR